MTSIRICVLAVTSVTAAVVIKNWNSDFLPLVRIAFAILFSGLILTLSAPLVAYLKKLTELAGASAYAECLIKALGIAVLGEICSEICRESGEQGAASAVLLAGKAEILLLALPLINDILSVAKELLNLGG